MTLLFLLVSTVFLVKEAMLIKNVCTESALRVDCLRDFIAEYVHVPVDVIGH